MTVTGSIRSLDRTERGFAAHSLQTLARDRAALAGAGVVMVALVIVAAAPLLAPSPPDLVDVTSRFAGSSAMHPLGTDQLGRDNLARLLYGGQLSLATAILTTAAITAIGIIVGTITGYYGGVVDMLVMRVVDVFLALPRLVLALAVTGVLGPGLINLMIGIIAVGWADYSRLVRGAVLSIRERPYVESARSVGATPARVMFRHILPNLLGQVLVLSTLDLGAILLTLSGLSFLGLGVRPPTPEWGTMLAEGKAFLDRAPQLMVLPGLAISLVVLGFNLLGDGLRDALDPRTRERRSE
ncbi:MAG: ABC transporter permease [Chloroflexota bacterium]|nr:ABC transporter permease [Chloroflexota bacterium]